MNLLLNGTEELLRTGLNVRKCSWSTHGKIRVESRRRCPIPLYGEFGSILDSGGITWFDNGENLCLLQSVQVACQQGA
jgi:hypothetical protein